MIHTGWLVTSTGRAWDVLHGSHHSSKKEAKRCARSVGGYAWKVKHKNDGTIILKPVKLR